MAGFSFSFAGDDIESLDAEAGVAQQSGAAATAAAAPQATTTMTTTTTTRTTATDSSAFPVQGKPQLPAERHDVGQMLSRLPSKIAYSLLDVELGQGRGTARLARRELWDVRVQLAAEDDDVGADRRDDSGLGSHDVRSGIYEGGFKSWESSVDLVKVLARDEHSPALALRQGPVRMIELGCGTALPSLAVFQWAAKASQDEPQERRHPLLLTLADYNPSVLYLVTLPNFVLAWALGQQQAGNKLVQLALSSEDDESTVGGGGGELELSDGIKKEFSEFLERSRITLSFVSGGWSSPLVELLYSDPAPPKGCKTLVVGAETIYSPFALGAFAGILLEILQREQQKQQAGDDVGGGARSIVAAKRLYFGVGGSLDDFVQRVTDAGATVTWLAEETEGVRRGVVECWLPQRV